MLQDIEAIPDEYSFPNFLVVKLYPFFFWDVAES